MKNDIIKELAEINVDWRDFEAASHATRQVVRRIGQDKSALRQLVDHVANSPVLTAMSEKHQLLNYLVVSDNLKRGFRLRIHISTDSSFDRPHDHRFSFSSYIVCGKYKHVIHRADQAIYTPDQTGQMHQWINRHNPDPVTDIRLNRVKVLLVRDSVAGNSYTMHHSVVHSTVTTPGTVSIFMRGPAEKDRSIIMDKATESFWWRFSKTEEPAERRQEKMMTKEGVLTLREQLESLGVI